MASVHSLRDIPSRVLLPATAQLISMMGFFYAGFRADRAMDKSGNGSYEAFAYWSGLAGVSFWIAAILWVGTIVACSFPPHTQPGQHRAALLYVILVPVVFSAVYVGFLLLELRTRVT